MKAEKLFRASLFAAGALAASRLWRSTNRPVKPVSEDAYAKVDDYIIDQMRRLRIPGVTVAIVEGEEIVHLRGFGKAHPGGEAPGPQTPFFIGSLTKSFTALAVMQLVEAGKVELDAPVQRYLPWFRVADPLASAQMTVRHLLHQTSSLPMLPSEAALADFDDHPHATERQARALSTLKLKRPVGAKFEYCNTNYNLLGLIVEAASGESYADYIRQHVFEPLEMQHSHTSKAAAQQDGLAMGHRYWFGLPLLAPNLPVPPGSLPSGQLIASAEDMAHYLIPHLNAGCYRGRQILSPAGIAELIRGVVEWKEMGFLIGYYGMGWVSQESGGVTIVSHSGTVPDFGAFMALIPGQNKAIVLLCNANHAMMKMALDEFGMGAAQHLAGVRPSPSMFTALAWVMPATLLIPLLQAGCVTLTMRLLRRWRAHPQQRPTPAQAWKRNILPPLLSHLLVASTLLPVLGKMRGWIRLFMPDYAWLALTSGSFSGLWAILRTGLLLRALQKP
jgi:CubicO group peptidase (beta-lactamase class C family)